MFDPSGSQFPEIIQVGTGVYAIVHGDGGNDGAIVTLSIGNTGNIGGSTIDRFEFNTARAFYPETIRLGNDIYAIVYEGPDLDGFLTTVEIDGNGVISGAVIETLEFDPDRAFWPDIVEVTPGIYAISYMGSGSDGFVITVRID